jgi:hypothetical protein
MKGGICLNKRERVLVAGMVVVVIAGGALAFWPTSSPSARATGPILPRPQAEKKIAEQTRAYKVMLAEQAMMQPRISNLTYDRVTEELVPRLVRLLQQKAKLAGVRLREVKPLRPRPMKSEAGERVPLEVRFRAPFQPNTVRFLYYLEDLKDKLVVEKLNIASADAQFRAVDVTVQTAVFTRALSEDQGDNANASATTQ